jgi:ribosomal protein S18 acetylase RimI-like enzyme
MSDRQIRLLTGEELKALHGEHMVRDFPPDELKPLPRLLELMETGNYIPYGLFQDGELAAYALYWRAGEDPYVMLDYFAVLPQLRNGGVGSAFLQEMLEQFCQNGGGVFGEVEAPVSGDPETDALRRRRLGFYDRAGLRKMGYTSRIFGVPYVVLAYGPEISDEALMETHRALYRSVFSDEMYEKNVFIPGVIQ